mgnify:CR=1 FL=1
MLGYGCAFGHSAFPAPHVAAACVEAEAYEVAAAESFPIDKTPVANIPETFTLNTPPTAEQYYELTPGGTIEFTCSQPDYGFVAPAIYSMEVSLDKENVQPLASNSPNSAAFTVNDADIATALCVLRGVDSPDNGGAVAEGVPVAVEFGVETEQSLAGRDVEHAAVDFRADGLVALVEAPVAEGFGPTSQKPSRSTLRRLPNSTTN